ncbi:hypothetical protein EXE50_17005, partial [Halorubrum sp. ARQ200]
VYSSDSGHPDAKCGQRCDESNNGRRLASQTSPIKGSGSGFTADRRQRCDCEERRGQFWARYERRRLAAASELRRQTIAKRASFSGGCSAARAMAAKHGPLSPLMTTALQADANSAGKDSPAPAKLYEKELLAKLIVVCEHKMSRRSRRGIVAGLTT